MTALGFLLVIMGMTTLVIFKDSKEDFFLSISLIAIGLGALLLFAGIGVWLWRAAP